MLMVFDCKYYKVEIYPVEYKKGTPQIWKLLLASGIVLGLGIAIYSGIFNHNSIRVWHNSSLTADAMPELFNKTDIVLNKGDRTVIRQRAVTVNFDLLTEANNLNRRIRLNLFDDTSYNTILTVGERNNDNSSLVWFGKIENVTNSQVTLVVTGKVMSGNITLTNGNYQIRLIKNGIHTVREINHQAFPAEAEPLSRPNRREGEVRRGGARDRN